MKIWYKEHGYNYDVYQFGYRIYAKQEKGDILSHIYEQGFLPMSSNEEKDVYYQARSCRVPIDTFELTSENRRVLKKFENRFTRTIVSVSEFNFQPLIKGKTFRAMVASYFSNVHNIDGEGKVKAITDSQFATDVVIYKENNVPVAYIILVQDGTMIHYWYSCFSSSLLKTSFGIWIILQEIQAAKKEQKKYFYIGTCYGNKGKYKMNFQPLEFWNGSSWTYNQKELKELLKADGGG